MAEGQIKSKGQKLASGCRHTVFEWDHHHFCISCREKNKGDDVCVTLKEEECFICLQFTPEQKKRLKAKKVYEKKKSSKESISKEVEDSLVVFSLQYQVPHKTNLHLLFLHLWPIHLLTRYSLY